MTRFGVAGRAATVRLSNHWTQCEAICPNGLVQNALLEGNLAYLFSDPPIIPLWSFREDTQNFTTSNSMRADSSMRTEMEAISHAGR